MPEAPGCPVRGSLGFSVCNRTGCLTGYAKDLDADMLIVDLTIGLGQRPTVNDVCAVERLAFVYSSGDIPNRMPVA
jgi:hypothetical protein